MRIAFDRVSMNYQSRSGPVHALSEVSLEVEPGEFVALVGPSGCGKSTLLKLLAGLMQPSAGHITVNGESVRGPRTDIGFMFQAPVLLPWKSVLQNVMLQCALRGTPAKDGESRARELLEAVGLSGYESNYVFELSGGMQQRVAFCRAVLHKPSVLLMDEPFGALDALTREQIALDLQRMWLEQGGQTVLFVTHSVPEAVLLSDRVAVFSARPGRLTEVTPVGMPRPRDVACMSTPAFGDAARVVRDRVTGGMGDGIS